MEKQSLMALPDFLEQAASLPKAAKSKLVKILWLLSKDTSHPSLRTKKVAGSRTGIFECRVDQGTRLVYDMTRGSLRCWYVGKHDAALKYATAIKRRKEGVAVDDIEIRATASQPQHLFDFSENGLSSRTFVKTDMEYVLKILKDEE